MNLCGRNVTQFTLLYTLTYSGLRLNDALCLVKIHFTQCILKGSVFIKYWFKNLKYKFSTGKISTGK